MAGSMHSEHVVGVGTGPVAAADVLAVARHDARVELTTTAGGARALRRPDIGALGVGARADLAVLDAPTYRHLAYRPGMSIARALDLAPAAAQ